MSDEVESILQDLTTEPEPKDPKQESRQEKLELVADWLTKYCPAYIVSKACRRWKYKANTARRLVTDARIILKARFSPEKLEELKAIVIGSVSRKVSDPAVKDRDQLQAAKLLSNMFGWNAPQHVVIEQPPLYPEIPVIEQEQEYVVPDPDNPGTEDS